MQTSPQPIRITGQTGRLTSGIFTDGPFKGERAITLDNGMFLPAGAPDPSDRTTSDVVNDIFGQVFGEAMKGGAA